jgi:hypothetical protein
MEQFNAVHGAVQRLEQGLTMQMGKVLRQAVLRASKPTNLIETDDGTQWRTSIDLTDDCCLCYRTTWHCTDLALVELS